MKNSAQYIRGPQAFTSGIGDEACYISTRSDFQPINIFAGIHFLCRRGKFWNQPLHHVMALEVKSQLQSAATPEKLEAFGPRYFIFQEVNYLE